MKQGTGMVVAVAVAALAAGGGYWIGARKGGGEHGAAPAAQSTAVAPVGAKKEPKLLYYRNPMGLPDTSPTPKKDPMGMDYVPVFEGAQDEEPTPANQIRITTEKIQKLGVRTEVASLRALDKLVRAAGRVEPDERRTFAISPKFEGYVERLHVNATGQPVAKGQALFEVYSPELVSAQREYAIAAQGVDSLNEAGGEAQAGMRQLAASSLMRLKNWDISEEQVKALAKSGETKRTLTFRSPVSGIVTEKKALQGMRFMPGEALYQVADLSAVWVVADVFEQDIGLVKVGAGATVKINAYPEKIFKGSVTYVYPTLTAETRTIPVRVELANPGQLLKPGMFAQMEVAVVAKGAVVTVPISAVIDSGTRRIVLIQAGEGQVAVFFRRANPRVVGEETWILAAQALLQRDIVEPGDRGNRSQTFGNSQGGLGWTCQQPIEAGTRMMAFGFHLDQLASCRSAFHLDTDRVLLRHQATGVARLGNPLDSVDQIDDFLRQGDQLRRGEILGIGGLDARRLFGPCDAGFTLCHFGLGLGHFALEIAFAPERQWLRQGVFGAADAAGQQVGIGLGRVIGDVLQLGAQHRVGQRASRIDTLPGRFSFQTHGGIFWISCLGIVEQAFDAGAQRGFLRQRGCRRSNGQHQDQRRHGGRSAPTDSLKKM